MRRLLLAALLALAGCDDGRSITLDTGTLDSTPSTDAQTADTATDGARAETAMDGPSDGGICINWKDMGIDCCDVCTEVYVTCKQSVKDQQGNLLSGKQCLAACGTATAGNAYWFVQCMLKVDAQVKCDPAALQTCFNKIFQ